jgi:hypothetical protein
MKHVIPALMALAVATVVLAVPTAPTAASTIRATSATRVTMTPIVGVHGIVLGSCPAMDSGVSMSGPMWYLWNHGEWGRVYDPISYFKCDVNGTDIGTAADNNTPIEKIAHDLAWYVYNKYSSHGQSVEMVGHSMGGLIIRAALTSFAAHDPSYPPTLLVQDVVTVSSPFAGTDFGCATSSYQCREMMPGSGFVTWLAKNQNPQATNGTDWTLLGGSPCDVVPSASATAMSGSHHWIYYRGTPTCYDHSSYLWDSSAATDAVVGWEPPGARSYQSWYAYHSQAAIMMALDSGSW